MEEMLFEVRGMKQLTHGHPLTCIPGDLLYKLVQMLPN